MNNNIKSLIVLALCSASGSVAFGAPVSPEEALMRFGDSSVCKKQVSSVLNNAKSNGIKPTLIYTAKENNAPTLYLFNVGEETICLSADDAVTPVLGYADGYVDSKDFPPAFVAWMQTISQEISLIREGEEGRNESSARSEDFEAIEPLCKTKWNQDNPYNLTCPKGSGDNKRCYTGCVATAMAQVMKYHNWPDVGEGRISYKWTYGNTNLSAIFSTQKFDWPNMLDTYTEGEYTDQEAVAVASLMRNCGISVQMSYSTSASGALSPRIANALGSFFKYDKASLRYVMRDYYSLEDWEDMIYNSLKNYGPVILDGQSEQGGHSFVCDGYDKDGYFHINWGWGGMSDGYFLLSVLDPYNQGIGGSGDNSGFNYMQDAIIGITPAGEENPTDAWTTQLYSMGDFGIDIEQEYEPGDAVGPLCVDGIYNYGPAALPSDAQLGIVFRAKNSEDMYVWGVELEQKVDLLYGFDNFNLPLPKEVPYGDYIVTLSYQSPTLNFGKWIDVLFKEEYACAYNATVSNGIIRFTDSDWRPSGVSDIEIPDMNGQKLYFNLQGMPVKEPAKGTVVIVKEGNKSYKKLF